MQTFPKIDGTPIKNPTNFSIGSYKISKSERLASGLMTFETIARKRTFQFKYEAITGPELDVIFDLLDNDNNFYTLTYNDRGQTHTAIVYTGAFKRDRFRTDSIEVWKNFDFQLIEQ